MKKSQHGESKIAIVLKKISYITFVMLLVPTFVFATDIASKESSEGSIVEVEEIIEEINGGKGVYGVIQEIIGVLSTAGFVIAVVKMMQIGINIMLGAAGKKYDAKSALIPWLVGALVCILFGTVGPWIIDLLMSGSNGGVFDI